MPAGGALPWESGGAALVPQLPLTGMIAGYEFSPAYVTFGTGAEVASVSDLSGNGNTLTAVGAGGSRMTAAQSASYGGQYVLTGTGTPGLARATWVQGSQSQPLWIACVGETVNVTCIVYDGGAGNFTGPYRYHSNVTSYQVGAGGTEIAGGARTKAGLLDQFEVDASGTDRAFRNNWATAAATGDAGDNAMQGVALGNHTIIGDFQGVIACWYAYSTMTAARLAQLAAYLNAKFATSITGV